MTKFPTTPAAQRYLQSLKGNPIVHKLSGSALEHEGDREQILLGIQQLMQHGIHCVLVSGAGNHISSGLNKKCIHPSTHLRITPKQHIPAIEQSIAHIGDTYSAHCERLGIPYAILPHSTTTATRLLDGHQETGGVVSVDRDAIEEVLQDGKLAILPFGGVDDAGNTLNVNADDVAARAAGAIGAKKLILYTNEDGILIPDSSGKMRKVDFLDYHTVFQLLRTQDAQGNFVLSGGMVPKVKAILEALMYGVEQVHVVRAEAQALIDELFSQVGSGTMIEKEQTLTMCYPAQEKHVSQIAKMHSLASAHTTPSGVPYLKPTSTAGITNNLQHTLVLEQKGKVIGSAQIDQLDGNSHTAKLGQFMVADNRNNSGYGRLLLSSAIEQMQAAGYTSFMALTASDGMCKLLLDAGGHAQEQCDWPHEFTNARKRYGDDAHMTNLFSVQIPQDV